MINQTELVRFLQLAEAAKEFGRMKEDLKLRYREDSTQENGPLVLKVSVVPTKNVSYKDVVDKVVENHPELAGAIAKMVIAATANTERWNMDVKPAVVKI